MRSRLLWLAGALGILWLVRRLRRRRAVEEGPDPADELRRKLDESRAAEDEPSEAPPEEAAPAEDLDERRRQAHDRGRSALDQMQDPGSSPD